MFRLIFISPDITRLTVAALEVLPAVLLVRQQLAVVAAALAAAACNASHNALTHFAYPAQSDLIAK